MAELYFKGDHNKHAFLDRDKNDEDYVDMMEFLRRSKICYALLQYPAIIYESLVVQFWETAHVRTVGDGPTEIVAVIDGEEHVVTESLVRTKLQLDDEGGVTELPKHVILRGLQAAGYTGDGKVWYKNLFCPKWRFLTHTLLQCMGSKSGGWDQFSTDIALVIVCLSQGRTFNFSKYIFNAMLENVKDTKLKYLLYPRFLQIILDIQTNDHTHLPVKGLSRKLFTQIKFKFNGVIRPLLPAMLPGGNPPDGAAADVAADAPVNDAPDASASVTPDFQTPPSPRPPTPVPSPQFTRQPTPSPLRPHYEDSADVDLDYSPPRTTDAPNTTDIPVDEAEGPVTLTSISALLNKYVTKVEHLEKDLQFTKLNLGKAVLTLVGRVKKLETKLKAGKRKGVVYESDDESSKASDKIDLTGLELLAATTLDSIQQKPANTRPESSRPEDFTHYAEPSTPKYSNVTYVRRKHSAATHNADSVPEVHISATSADIQVDCPDVSTDIPCDPPEFTTHQADKGKSILADNSSPPRVKTKEELANEILSENVAVHMQAKEEALAAKEKEEYNVSVALAKKIQADLDKLGPSIPSNLTAARKRELDAIAKDLSPAQWEILAKQAAGLGASIPEVQDPDYAKMMVERKKLQNKHEAELKAKHLKERPWTKPEIRSYRRNFVKNQSSTLFGS
jgi:hypothetical protein